MNYKFNSIRNPNKNMEKFQTGSESNAYYKIKPSKSFLNNLISNRSDEYKENGKIKVNLKVLNIQNNSKIRIFPGIIEKKDLLLNNNKILFSIKDLISNKIKAFKGLAKSKKDKKINIIRSNQLCENNKGINIDNKFKITNQQIFIQSVINNNSEMVDFESNIVGEEHQKSIENFNPNKHENGELAEIKNKFLGSFKLRNTTPLIDEETELKRLHLNNNNNYSNLFIKNERSVDFKIKTSDNYFMNKTKNKNLTNLLSPHDNNKQEEDQDNKKNQRCQSNSLTNRERISVKNKSAGSLSEFNIKNFNPESQIYFKSEFFEQIDNLYPIYRKKDYFIKPSRKLNGGNNKSTSIENFGFFPNRKNNNSILYKMRNSDVMVNNRNIYSPSNNENRQLFNFMNPQVMDFFEFDSELKNKKLSINKHLCDGSFRNKDSTLKKEKINLLRTQFKSGSGPTQNHNLNGNSINSRSKTSINNKNMNGDLTCFSNIKIFNNIHDRVEKLKVSDENKAENTNCNKLNSLSNTFSNPNDNLIKSKNIINNNNNNNNNRDENYYAMGNEQVAKDQMQINKIIKKNSENLDFQSLNINLNFSHTSSEDLDNNDGKSKNKRKSASMDLVNKNNLKFKSGNDIPNYYELSKNSYENLNEKTKKKNSEDFEDIYSRNSFYKINFGEINNPLIIKKYEIRNMEKGNMLKLANGKLSYLPFQKYLNVEKIHFNFSNRSSINNINNNLNSTTRISNNNYNLGKSDGLKNFSNPKKLIIFNNK
jgi:hypothetical protein